MKTTFATHNGCVSNTAVTTSAPYAPPHAPLGETAPAVSGSGLGGQIGELAAALNTIGWNHNQVPAAERVPASEREAVSATAAGSGLGGQIGELAAALNTVGWNHNQVPADERVPLQERT